MRVLKDCGDGFNRGAVLLVVIDSMEMELMMMIMLVYLTKMRVLMAELNSIAMEVMMQEVDLLALEG